MQLFCDVCNCNHEFTLPDMERLVYCLQADELNSAYHPAEEEPIESCLKDVIRYSFDAEMYEEHVESMVANREALEASCEL